MEPDAKGFSNVGPFLGGDPSSEKEGKRVVVSPFFVWETAFFVGTEREPTGGETEGQ